MSKDHRYYLLHLIDRVTDPIYEQIDDLCKELGHEFIDDQCGKPEHRICVYCQTKVSDDATPR